MPPLHIVHACDTLIVADKPADLLAVPGKGEGVHNNLATQLQAQYADALVVHRLDMATSGLMVFARGAAVQRLMSMAFAARRVHKRYVAVVQGALHGDTGEVDAPLQADWPRRPRQMVSLHAGKLALTRWQVLAREPECTRVLLEPVTGRSHQLRVHMQHIGHPICGDTLYGPDPPQAPRLLLHASELAFAHPLTGAPLAFASAPPF